MVINSYVFRCEQINFNQKSIFIKAPYRIEHFKEVNPGITLDRMSTFYQLAGNYGNVSSYSESPLYLTPSDMESQIRTSSIL